MFKLLTEKKRNRGHNTKKVSADHVWLILLPF